MCKGCFKRISAKTTLFKFNFFNYDHGFTIEFLVVENMKRFSANPGEDRGTYIAVQGERPPFT